MKYLVVIQLSSGYKNANIFDTLGAAEDCLENYAEKLKYPIQVEWSGNDGFYAEINESDWIRARIVKTERAEYRLTLHKRGEKDIERRFSVRENAVKYVEGDFDDVAKSENERGEWDRYHEKETIYRLYAVILESEKGSSKVLKRFGAAVGGRVLFSDIGGLFEEEKEYEDEEDYGKVAYDGEESRDDWCAGTKVREKEYDEREVRDNNETSSIWKRIKKAFERFLRKIKFKRRKKIYIAIGAVVIALVVAGGCLIDWQLIIDEQKASSFNASSEVTSLASSLSFTRKGRATFFASQPRLLSGTEFNKTCGKDGSETFTSGCYYKDLSGNEHIDIYDVGTNTFIENGLIYSFGDYRKSVALHEMLHAVWERIGDNNRTSACKDLEVLSNQIGKLKESVSMYESGQLCNELFARVGSEYIQILSPKNSVPTNSSAPVSNSSLSTDGKAAVERLVKIYDVYFDTTKNDWVLKNWDNDRRLSAYQEAIVIYRQNLRNKEASTNALINQYYSWPTWGRYYTANNAISEYNNMVAEYNKYVDTYNKVYSKLDSEKTISSGSYLGL